jgi:hypothetical protein
MAGWLVVFIAFVTLLVFHFTRQKTDDFPSHISSRKVFALIWWSVLLLFISFFWTGFHLAKAKGYSGAICLMGLPGPPAQLAVLIGLLVMRDRHSRNPAQNRPKKLRHHGSNVERIVICRRNAVVGIFFGLCGIAAGVFLVLFRVGIVLDRQNEIVIGILVFMVGYAGVITGCWWWLKAKHWIDAIVFIGLMPLGVCLIPYVRLIFVAIPRLLPVSMVFMPLVLLVVVFVLPDKSGWVGRKRWRIHRDGDEGNDDF